MKLLWILSFLLVASGCNQEKKEPTRKAQAPPEYFKVDPATAASLKGTVHFTGKKPAGKKISMHAEEGCEKLHPAPVVVETVSTGARGELANVYVYIQSGLEGKVFEPPKEAVVLDQHGCMFVPRVIALHTGQTLEVKNSDPVSHNIHPLPRNNYEWNQQQSPGTPDLRRRFSFSEVMIPVKCNVHNWMRAYIGVMNHPYFAVTDEHGAFEWTSIPPGDYTVVAWHETLGEQTHKVTLTKSASEVIDFTFQ